MDPFSFHPPGLSPSSATTYQQLSPTDSPGRPGSGSDGYQRSGSAGGGASAAGGFTATLPPLHEQPSNESVPGTHGGAARPGSASYGRLEGDFGATGDGDGGDLFASTSSGRRSHPQDLSQPAPSAAERRDEDMTAAVSMAMLGSRDHLNSSGGHCASETAHEIASDSVFGFNPPPLDPPNPGLSMANHAFFHPQMVHPSVNTRNTRPMTAPSRSGYLTGLQYSSVPSAFYVPPQLQHIPSLNGSISPTNYEAPPGSGNHELFAYQPEVSTPQFELPTPRSRGFSVPDALATSALGDRPATAEGSDALSAGGPFFFQPPLPPEGRPVVLPGYVPAGMEPFAMGAMPPPAFPPAQHLPDPADGFAPSLDGQHERRRSSAPAGKYNFVAQPPQHRKRPRRRYDEIERMYNCDYPGCTKAYGTLNHLNSHKTMQKHGPKATPAREYSRCSSMAPISDADTLRHVLQSLRRCGKPGASARRRKPPKPHGRKQRSRPSPPLRPAHTRYSRHLSRLTRSTQPIGRGRRRLRANTPLASPDKPSRRSPSRLRRSCTACPVSRLP